MAETSLDEDVRASINNELQDHYQRLVDAYRPDLKADIPPREPVFHPLHPCHLAEEREKDRRQINVADILTTQLNEIDDHLPQHVLLLGRPESGKTALLAQILHYWLHDKGKMMGMKKFDFLLAFQCLVLGSHSDGKTAIDLEKHMLDHLPKSVEKHGEEVVQQTMRKAKVLIIIDSLDCLAAERALEVVTSLSSWTDSSVLLFCRYKFMKENYSHLFHSDEIKDYLVLKLWGGLSFNPFETLENSLENISEIGGVFSDKLLKDYCKKLCNCRNISFEKFWDYYTEMLKYLSLDIRKPFNIHITMEAFCQHIELDVKTQSEFYRKWFDICSKTYRVTLDGSDYDKTEMIMKGIPLLTRLAYKAFNSNNEYLSKEDIQENHEMVPFFTHFLMPHYNPQGNVEKFTFRITAHRLFLAAKQAVTEIDLGIKNVKDVLNDEAFKTFQSLLLMVLGIARGSKYFDEIKEQALKIAKLNLEDHVTEAFRDPIINYAVNVLSEVKLFSKTHNNFDDFARKLMDCLQPNNWSIVDGNIHPEALRTLCECGHDNKDPDKCKPQKLNIILSGSHTEMPGLPDILRALKNCDMRVNFSNYHSLLNDEGEFPLDDVISALQSTGEAFATSKRGPSLASFRGYLENIKKLDTYPATRRVYKIGLRICSNKNYEDLRELCKVSHKLRQVILRISHKADINVRKLKELPASIAKLTVYLEGYTDNEAEQAIKIWRSIQGTTQREVRDLRFWFTDERRMTFEGVKKIIKAHLPGTKIELSLEQPVENDHINDIKNLLDQLKENNYIIRFLGSYKYQRFDLT
uniref:NACHT domain-containing protein n=1 Tax=Scylla olivacea TaxID=85551 RepID=A0A0P4WJZ3_SCYOL